MSINNTAITRPLRLSVLRALRCCKWICAGFVSAPRTVRHCALMRGVSGRLSHTHSSQRNPLLRCQTSPTVQHMTVNTNTPTCTNTQLFWQCAYSCSQAVISNQDIGCFARASRYLLPPRPWGGCSRQWCGRKSGGWWGRGCRWTCPPGKAHCAGPAALSRPPSSGTSEATSPSPGSQDGVSKCSQEFAEGIL